MGLGCGRGSWRRGWLQWYPANALIGTFFFLAQTSHRPGAVEGRWGGAVGYCWTSVSFIAFLGQQQSGGGHGEGREPACDQRRLLCILGERYQTSKWALWDSRSSHPVQSMMGGSSFLLGSHSSGAPWADMSRAVKVGSSELSVCLLLPGESQRELEQVKNSWGFLPLVTSLPCRPLQFLGASFTMGCRRRFKPHF